MNCQLIEMFEAGHDHVNDVSHRGVPHNYFLFIVRTTATEIQSI